MTMSKGWITAATISGILALTLLTATVVLSLGLPFPMFP